MSDPVFAVHPRNHRCFLHRGRPLKVLTSAEHYGAVLNADFDYDAYLEEMGRTGQNGTRVFTFYREKAASIPGPGPMNTLAPTPQASGMPWERVSRRGKAADGLVSGEVPGCGCAAATDGAGRHILYVVDDRVYRLEACEPRKLAVSLALPAGRYRVQAFDTRTGEARGMPEIQDERTTRLEIPEFTEDVAVLLEKA